MAPRAWKAEQSLQRCADCWPWSMGVRFHPSALSSSSSSSSCWINLTPDSGSLHTLYCCKQLQQLGAFIEQIIEHLNTCCDPIGQKKMLQICLLGCAEVFRSSGWWEGRRPNWLEQIAGDIGVWGWGDWGEGGGALISRHFDDYLFAGCCVLQILIHVIVIFAWKGILLWGNMLHL